MADLAEALRQFALMAEHCGDDEGRWRAAGLGAIADSFIGLSDELRGRATAEGEAKGGRKVAERIESFAGAELAELAFGWDLSAEQARS